MKNCTFSDSDFTDSNGCDNCEERKHHLCEIYEGKFLSTQERFSTYTNTCKRAVFVRDDDLNHYTCGKNGGICDVFRFKKCTKKEDIMQSLFSEEELRG